jgi:hypothetical protein
LSVQFTVIQQADCYRDIGQSLHLYETKTSAKAGSFVADRKRTDHSARSREVLVERAARYGAGKIANINPGHLDLLRSQQFELSQRSAKGGPGRTQSKGG